MSNFLELARSRRSVRTFDGKEPDTAMIKELKEFSEEITNPYGIPVKFVFLYKDEHKLSSPVLTGEKLYVAAIVDKGQYAEEAYGYSFEALLMRAHELGLGTVWIGGTMPRDKFENAAGLSTNQIMPCISPVGKAANKMSVKETLMRKGVKADSRFKFVEMFFDGDFDTPLTVSGAMDKGIYNALECVRLAPSAVNKQPWRVVVTDRMAHFYEKHDKGYITPDYDLQKIDLGIAMYHFEKDLALDGRKAALEIENPGISTPSDVDYVASYKW
ncbi:MAG: nitroreductase [Butyrivibrio sp.]|nr:nitroreductase [Butyrivibrio sp.]